MNIDFTRLKKAMVAQTHRHGIISNNLANTSTVGFKRDRVFLESLSDQSKAGTNLKVYTDFAQGPLKQTTNPLDMAISGDGFFTLLSEQGEVYTRDGHFTVDQDGILRATDGDPVVGLGGIIALTEDGETTGELVVTKHGEIFIDGTLVDRLKITGFESPSQLVKQGKNQFIAGEDAEPQLVEDTAVYQGFIENSNVNPVEEMIGLIELQRRFETSQKAAQALDDALKGAASKIGQFR